MWISIDIDADNYNVNYYSDESGALITSAPYSPATYSHDDYIINQRTIDGRINLYKRGSVGTEGNFSGTPYRSWPSERTVVNNDTNFTTESQPLPDPIDPEA